jgi:hypothetical protein
MLRAGGAACVTFRRLGAYSVFFAALSILAWLVRPRGERTITMQYLLLIYNDERSFMSMPKDEATKVLGDFNDFTASVKASGHYVGSNRLQPVASATTVRVRGGKPQLTDGPFAETREQLGGYYLIEAKDLDEATKIASRIPGARYGSVEVRPIWAM